MALLPPRRACSARPRLVTTLPISSAISSCFCGAALLKRGLAVPASSRQTDRALRIHPDLRRRGGLHGYKRIVRLMRDAGLVEANHRHGGPTTTRHDEDPRPGPDLVDSSFVASGPNQL